MGFCISIEKISEDGDQAIYKFSESSGIGGTFAIDKNSGETRLLESIQYETQIPSEVLNTQKKGSYIKTLYIRASRKISLSWKEGTLPERAMYEA